MNRSQSPHEFYEAVSQRKPGQEVTLQVAGKGAIAIPVGQYIDQLNALLFVFVTAAEKLTARISAIVVLCPRRKRRRA